MQDTGWDHALKVTGNGEGLVGHAGAVLLRKLRRQAHSPQHAHVPGMISLT